MTLLFALWLTKAFAALQFYKVEPLAGKLLALTLTWITAAAALTTRTQFTEAEFKAFEVKHLKSDCFIKSSNAYYKPASMTTP